MEAMVKGQLERPQSFPKFITCPSEMVALSMADGYARVTGEPQAVIVHVDVGTQALGCAVHNASVGRVPVFIFAGLSPCTLEGEYRGSRTEFIHWLQDVPDQKAIVSQYCRYTTELKKGKNIKQMVNRALSFATSEPRGPVYLQAVREVMEEVIEPYEIRQEFWSPVELGGLTPKHLDLVAEALVSAREPLVVTGYCGRDTAVVPLLVELANIVKGLRVLDTSGSDLCFPADHPGWLSVRYGSDEAILTADAILVVDCDVPWINTQCKPTDGTKIIHFDIDPLKQQMPLFYIDAVLRCRVNTAFALGQITQHLKTELSGRITANQEHYTSRWSALQASYTRKLEVIASQAEPNSDSSFGCGFLISQVRRACPINTIWVVEAVTNTFTVADHLQATLPGSVFSSGAGGLGWSGGAALGIKLATDSRHGGLGKFVCQIIGDGCFFFSIPASVYWIAQRYEIPVLTIVLNNNGWNAPRKSLLLVHPDGLGSRASNEELNISFAPNPDYSTIAKAASGGKCWAGRASTVEELARKLPEAIDAVQSGISAILDARLARTL
ncbi:probable thiamine pyrophosphate-requiring enzymes [acetolactate synthase, pyruvate dehydrogenase (cytochrome), glyoxylate carboligase, phosphonopyruvate decarboxylase] [Phialocephala subalpina]|uniref:Probable thiamine pyrophosphate-requiring enzymes [acetolactate synthase, pyruvate dehydrogenase (Cytochrome), glyoxylate carboligase, phosphonopyruvate decarboxylase] n=1 Tax=Phialocephala subalpina TaxID=576137 RepID=A0A1L7XY94_9HELO|nr:probable thiamine pyrophosphate-requiring enzymes [acetolactate synthase, pyruvate dehydrogenase (cytochrome), glyoxylate carboligase, phosphonopyruvate decarboxylase] [Phialocephala subalpina]